MVADEIALYLDLRRNAVRLSGDATTTRLKAVFAIGMMLCLSYVVGLTI